MQADRSSDAHEAESTYSKATKAELAKEYDRAFRLYVKSAELYLHLSRLHKGNNNEVSWKASAGKALQRAEKIKTFVEKSSGVSGSKSGDPLGTTSDLRLTPIGVDHFSRHEQFYVLKKGELVNGLVFPPWDEPLRVPSGLSSTSQYQDLDGQPKLSPEQIKGAPVWRRPQELVDVVSPTSDRPRRGLLPQEILQHIVTDCSVCASISVCLEHARRFGSNLAESAVYHLAERNRPRVATISQDSQYIDTMGGYDIKVYFNGAWRRVIIDDKLPYHPADGTLMCMSVLSSGDDSRLLRMWPSILEKGYMKLMGGYDFPGSNSSIDLHVISGWIPEHIEIKGPSFEREKTWDRIIYGFQNGLSVITLGTGTRSNAVWEGIEILASHSYAVIDITEGEGIRTFTILDTWVKPGQEGQRKQPETLRMSWSDVLNVFDGIYLSWDPVRWSQTLTFHGMWKRSGFEEESSTRHFYLNFENGNETSEEIWILLTRHVVDSRRISEFISLKVEIEDELTSNSKGVDHTISAKGTYTNSTHFLVRTRIPVSQQSGVLSIFTSYDGGSTEVGFTLTVYAGENFVVAWDEQVAKPLFTNKIEGVLTSKNGGGNCTYPSFMLNPQYHLQIFPSKDVPSASAGSEAKLALTMQTGKDVPIQIALVWSQGERIDELVEKELAASSGAYNYGLARVVKGIASGDYTMILSAFEPRHMGPFSLKIECSHPFDIKPITQEGAGMYTKTIRGAWTSQTARGGPTSGDYSKNPKFEIDVPSLTHLKLRLQLLRSSASTPLNIALFPASSDGTLGRYISTSGPYNGAISGVATPQTTISAGKYLVVPSTYNPGVEAEFQVIMYSKISGIRVIER